MLSQPVNSKKVIHPSVQYTLSTIVLYTPLKNT